MQLKEIEINKIIENPWNPNEMTESQLNHLKEEYKRIGYLQPILVRPKEGNYEIIDGVHRFRAYKVLKLKNIPVIVKEMDDRTAMITTLNLNEIKGENNPIKYAELIIDLETTFTKEQLSNLLNKSEKDLDAYKILLELPQKELDLELLKKVSDRRRYILTFNAEQEDIFLKAIRKSNKQVTDEAIIIICEAYLKK